MIYWSIDVDDYSVDDLYVINGWGFSEDGSPLTVKVQGIPEGTTSVQVVAQKREDLIQAFPERSYVADCGFQIQIQNASLLFEKVKKIQIVIGDKEKQIVDRTVEDMKQICKKRLMQYNVDVQAIHGKYLIVQGWWIDKCSNTSLFIEDGKGNRLEIESKRLYREDVQKIMEVEENYKAGFNIRVELEKIHTAKVYLVLENPIVSEKIEIPVKEMLFEISTKGKLWNALKPEKRDKRI